MIRHLIILTLALFLLAPPGQALAHAIGQSQDLPLPFWLYLFGASAVVAISFVKISLFVAEEHTLGQYPRLNLLAIGPLRVVLTSWPLLPVLRLLSVTLFLLVVLSGFVGVQVADQNLAPIFVWIIWWVSLIFFTALVGSIWSLVNPWKILFEWAEKLAERLGVKKDLELSDRIQPAWASGLRW